MYKLCAGCSAVVTNTQMLVLTDSERFHIAMSLEHTIIDNIERAH